MSLVIAIGTSDFFLVASQLRKFKGEVTSRLGKMLAQVGEQVVGVSREDYLSGPRPGKLGRKTGALARQTNYAVSGNVVKIGNNLPYGHIHEEGFVGPQLVSAHDRRVKTVFGRYRGFVLQHVMAHTRMMVMPARPYLKTALKDSEPVINVIVARNMEEARKAAFGK